MTIAGTAQGNFTRQAARGGTAALWSKRRRSRDRAHGFGTERLAARRPAVVPVPDAARGSRCLPGRRRAGRCCCGRRFLFAKAINLPNTKTVHQCRSSGILDWNAARILPSLAWLRRKLAAQPLKKPDSSRQVSRAKRDGGIDIVVALLGVIPPFPIVQSVPDLGIGSHARVQLMEKRDLFRRVELLPISVAY